MQIKRKDLFVLLAIGDSLAKKTFNINTQYKILKIIRAAKEEKEIFDEQFESSFQDIFQKDESGKNFLVKNGGFVIEDNKQNEALEKNEELLSVITSIPDIYFSLDELKDLGLTLEELGAFMPFIK